MKRKIVSALVCAAMVATMVVGCGSSSTTTAPAEDATEAPAEEEAEAPAENADAEEAPAESEGGNASGDVLTIGFAQVGHESDWRTASTKSCQDVFSAENGYDLQFVDCDNDSAVQLEAVRGFIEQDVDYIIIDPIVSTGWDTVLTECEDAGIPVIVIDRTIDDSDKYAAWVGSNFKTEGLAAGEWLKAYAAAKVSQRLMLLLSKALPELPQQSDVQKASRRLLTEKAGLFWILRAVTSLRMADRKLWSPTANPMKENLM